MKNNWFKILVGSICGISVLLMILSNLPVSAGAASGIGTTMTLLKVILGGICAVTAFAIFDSESFLRIIGVNQAPATPPMQKTQQSHQAPRAAAPQPSPATPPSPTPTGKFKPGSTAGASPAAAQPAPAMPSKPQEISREDIELALTASLNGLVNMDELIHNLTPDMFDFLNQKTTRSMAVVLWGDASTGKTQLGQRLAGLKASENAPGLDLPGVKVLYRDSVDKQAVRDLVDKAPARSVVIIDEADKVFDIKAGSTDQEAAQVRSTFITHFERTPIFWILMGSFADRRQGSSLTKKMVYEVFGPEMGSRLMHDGYHLKSWDQASLLKAVQQYDLPQDFEMDDEAVQKLTDTCLKMGGGPRSFEMAVKEICKRISRKNVQEKVIKLNDVNDYLAENGV